MTIKNLVIVHLESTSWQRVAAFPSAYPNLGRVLENSRVFDWLISSATSTRMVLTYLLHCNDSEYDSASDFGRARPVVNNPDIFSILRARGYCTSILCLDVLTPDKVYFEPMSDIWPRPAVTSELSNLIQKFDELTDSTPFAIYILNLITHLEHSRTLASASGGLTDQVARACAAADDALGRTLAILERKNLINDTTLIVYGDHGEDLWTHGFKGGMTHATEPYTDIVHVPLAICDVSLPNGRDDRIASTIDIVPTCLELLGVPAVLPFRESGQTLLKSDRQFAFAQNFFARQPDNKSWGVRKAFSVTDRTHTLLVSSAGLEFYAHRLDPGNHTNLLHFFDIESDGQLALRAVNPAGAHFCAALRDNPDALDNLSREFGRLRTSLKTRIAAKHDFERRADQTNAFDPGFLDRVNRIGRDRFFTSSLASGSDGVGPARNRLTDAAAALVSRVASGLKRHLPPS